MDTQYSSVQLIYSQRILLPTDKVNDCFNSGFYCFIYCAPLIIKPTKWIDIGAEISIGSPIRYSATKCVYYVTKNVDSWKWK